MCGQAGAQEEMLSERHCPSGSRYRQVVDVAGGAVGFGVGGGHARVHPEGELLLGASGHGEDAGA